ncbi:MAG TPA: arsenic resistance N-acetyltransferase ArsN2 [Rhodocyclaceae bacterium]
MPSPPEDLSFVAATPDRLPELAVLLGGLGLPADDLAPALLPGFELALDTAGRLIGAAGIEVAGGDALLRSVAAAADWRGRGLGRRLVERREAAARAAGIRRIYLLTTGADAFFRHLGYCDMARDEVPAAIAAHPQFRTLCPKSATCLAKEI